jgi:hypothetical protein
MSKEIESRYFKNLENIELSWKVLLKNNFSSLQERDNFWRLCMEGQELFWTALNSWKKSGFVTPKNVPAYKRAVMLLVKENKIKDAIRMCDIANSLKIETDWYFNKKDFLIKKYFNSKPS